MFRHVSRNKAAAELAVTTAVEPMVAQSASVAVAIRTCLVCEPKGVVNCVAPVKAVTTDLPRRDNVCLSQNDICYFLLLIQVAWCGRGVDSASGESEPEDQPGGCRAVGI